jgi:hypothetical protein
MPRTPLQKNVTPKSEIACVEVGKSRLYTSSLPRKKGGWASVWWVARKKEGFPTLQHEEKGRDATPFIISHQTSHAHTTTTLNLHHRENNYYYFVALNNKA